MVVIFFPPIVLMVVGIPGCHFIMDKIHLLTPNNEIQVTTAAQTPAEVAESTGRADSSVNKRPAQRTTWNPKQPFINGCLVISNHFLCKDWESSN